MGRPDITVPDHSFLYGSDSETLCRECQLPCQLDTTSVDCFRRFLLQGYLHCTYFVRGYCFLVDEKGCVFDNGGRHDTYWMNLLNQYYHNVKDIELKDPDFVKHVDELNTLVDEQINNRQVSLCRYVEEIYNHAMGNGGGLGEEMMDDLDEAFLALLGGTSRKD